MKIAVFGNVFRPAIIKHIQALFDYFEQATTLFLLDEGLYAYLRKENVNLNLNNVLVIENDDFDADVVLSIGGDGTFLKTAAHVGAKEIPILGINTGRLGFLTNIADNQFSEALKLIKQQEYQIEERSLLYVESSANELFEYPYVLNEMAILKQDTSSMIAINAIVNGEPIHTYQADGLVIATPTGSTAYSMSVGGPIVVPQAQSIVLSPIASHSLNVRPLIIPDDWVVELEVSSRTNSFLVALDGRSKVMGSTDTKLRITKAKHVVKIIKQHDYTFFDTLKDKLMWGLDKRNGLKDER